MLGVRDRAGSVAELALELGFRVQEAPEARVLDVAVRLLPRRDRGIGGLDTLRVLALHAGYDVQPAHDLHLRDSALSARLASERDRTLIVRALARS